MAVRGAPAEAGRVDLSSRQTFPALGGRRVFHRGDEYRPTLASSSSSSPSGWAPGVGIWRLELEFQDGRLRRCFRHEGPIGADALVRFDFPSSPSSR